MGFGTYGFALLGDSVNDLTAGGDKVIAIGSVVLSGLNDDDFMASEVSTDGDTITNIGNAYFDLGGDNDARASAAVLTSYYYLVSCGPNLCIHLSKELDAMTEWTQALRQAERARFGCRRVQSRYVMPSLSVIRRCLIRVDPDALDQALWRWQAAQGCLDEALAMDGKTMKGAVDASGAQTHILSLVGHQSGCCYTQKKSGR